MTPGQEQAFLDASGIRAASLNFDLRLIAGLLITVIAVFILIGLMKLLDSGQSLDHIRFLLYLITLSIILMIFFSFVVA